MLKKLFYLPLLFAFIQSSHAQINTFPATEGFENSFLTGLNIDFLPNWKGNEVTYGSRIFRDSINAQSGLGALGIIPTSSFDAAIIVSFNLTGQNNFYMDFSAGSEANGTGNRPSLLFMSTSIDGGLSYSSPIQISDSIHFANAYTPYSNYTYNFPFNTFNQPDVKLKIFVTRGNGSGTAAELFLDDVTFNSSSVDLTPPIAVSGNALNLNIIEVAFNEPVNASAEVVSNYSGLPGISSAVRNGSLDKVILTLSNPLILGQWYVLTVSGISDIAGNVMPVPVNFTVVFNNNTGNVKLTEILYNNPGNDTIEFIEIKNMDSQSIVIGGWRFDKGIDFMLPSSLTIPSNGYLVFAKYKGMVDNFFGINSISWGSSSLDNNGEVISLVNSTGDLIDSVHYEPTLPWDTLANGFGSSLVLCNEASDNDLPSSWTHATDTIGFLNGGYILANPMAPCGTSVGIDEVPENEVSVLVYPNPAHEIITVIVGKEGRYHINILDMSRKSVLTVSLTGKTIQLNTSDLPKGLYNMEYQQTETGFIGHAKLILN